jgi:hypothetical protein
MLSVFVRVSLVASAATATCHLHRQFRRPAESIPSPVMFSAFAKTSKIGIVYAIDTARDFSKKGEGDDFLARNLPISD